MVRVDGSSELSLEEVERRWTRWRRGRERGRAPNELWRLAADMAAVHGVERTAMRLKLDAERLRDELQQQQGVAGGSAPMSFVELSPFPTSPGGEWTVELEEASGRKLRITCKGSSTAQAIQVAQGLWRVPS
jgi:hypothetical protein